MRRFLLTLAVVVGYAMLMIFPAGAPAGPQPLPDQACNQGTANAHAQGAGGAESIPHQHDFNSNGIYGCYHFNLTYPPPNPTLE